MRDEPAVAKTYLDYAALHADLLQITSAQHGRHIVPSTLRTHRSVANESAAPGRECGRGSAVAAVLLVGITATPWRSSDENRANLTSGEVLPEIDGMAVISDIEDVVWSEGAHVFQEGQLLQSKTGWPSNRDTWRSSSAKVLSWSWKDRLVLPHDPRRWGNCSLASWQPLCRRGLRDFELIRQP